MKAQLNYIRIAPRKLRLVADTVRGKSLKDASVILKFSKNKGAGPLLKLLSSAEANAKNNSGVGRENLRISKLLVNEGPVFKRHMARARGSASLIRKKTSKVIIILSEH
ncbi:MAG: 50S ribosomal protein L22 [Candidatus Niyogibacteria bacterium]|nr:50S ribosomal protein L22 [Candidatus Niyogibacteria bacterium]